MKRKLLLLFLGMSFFSHAWIFQSENFNSLTLGNIGTSINGDIVGQGGWKTISNNGSGTTSDNIDNSNFQVISNGKDGTQGFQMTGPNGDTGYRYMWKDGLDASWASRTSGNNDIEVEFDFYTDATSTSKTITGISIYDSSYTSILSGISYNSETRVLEGIAYLNFGGTYANAPVNLTTSGSLVLTSNTWYSIGVGYNTTNGKPYWRVGTANPSTSVSSAYWVAPVAPVEVDFYQVALTGNTVAYSAIFDNFIVKATNGDKLLGTKSFETEKITIYPNPAQDFISITNVENGSEIEAINVSSLDSGIYLINITTGNESIAKKFIKR